jgi:hypothetical protein
MIVNNDELQFAVKTWQKMVDLISGIENAPADRFSDESPNWLTKQRLEPFWIDFQRELLALGTVRITVHAPCGSRRHEASAKWKLGTSKGYWRVCLADGRSDAELVKDEDLFVDGVLMETDFDMLAMFQTGSQETCPCNKNRTPSVHAVCKYFARPKDGQSRLGNLCAISEYLLAAIEKSDERRPRSAIREQLLLALLDLERLIAQKTIFEVIEQTKTGF